jgi:hypothetical protein
MIQSLVIQSSMINYLTIHCWNVPFPNNQFLNSQFLIVGGGTCQSLSSEFPDGRSLIS